MSKIFKVFSYKGLFTKTFSVLAAASLMFPYSVFTMPTNPVIVSGAATKSVSNNTLTITNSPGAIINWKSFSISPDETVDFDQENSSSVVLNRVVGENPSYIMGDLVSNGQVYLINPSGVFFGPDATINTAGLVASTLSISNADFESGDDDFTGTSTAEVDNQGSITALPGGKVVLIGQSVTNSGIITADNGTIWLAAGQSVNIVDTTNPQLSFDVTAPNDTAVNLGQLVASGGTVALLGAAVTNSGSIATSAASTGGVIDLLASNNVTTLSSSTLDANALQSGNGGAITITGGTAPDDTVSVSGQLSATGGAISGNGGAVTIQGGGTVTFGGAITVNGGLQSGNGGSASILGTGAVYDAPYSSITADAITNGNGGSVQVKGGMAPGDVTWVTGTISATPGTHSGVGGSIETSGDWVNFYSQGGHGATLDTGYGGTWTLDPAYIAFYGTSDNLGKNLTSYSANSKEEISPYFVDNTMDSGADFHAYASAALWFNTSHGPVVFSPMINPSNSYGETAIFMAPQIAVLDSSVPDGTGTSVNVQPDTQGEAVEFISDPYKTSDEYFAPGKFNVEFITTAGGIETQGFDDTSLADDYMLAGPQGGSQTSASTSVVGLYFETAGGSVTIDSTSYIDLGATSIFTNGGSVSLEAGSNVDLNGVDINTQSTTNKGDVLIEGDLNPATAGTSIGGMSDSSAEAYDKGIFGNTYSSTTTQLGLHVINLPQGVTLNNVSIDASGNVVIGSVTSNMFQSSSYGSYLEPINHNGVVEFYETPSNSAISMTNSYIITQSNIQMIADHVYINNSVNLYAGLNPAAPAFEAQGVPSSEGVLIIDAQNVSVNSGTVLSGTNGVQLVGYVGQGYTSSEKRIVGSGAAAISGTIMSANSPVMVEGFNVVNLFSGAVLSGSGATIYSAAPNHDTVVIGADVFLLGNNTVDVGTSSVPLGFLNWPGNSDYLDANVNINIYTGNFSSGEASINAYSTSTFPTMHAGNDLSIIGNKSGSAHITNTYLEAYSGTVTLNGFNAIVFNNDVLNGHNITVTAGSDIEEYDLPSDFTATNGSVTFTAGSAINLQVYNSSAQNAGIQGTIVAAGGSIVLNAGSSITLSNQVLTTEPSITTTNGSTVVSYPGSIILETNGNTNDSITINSSLLSAEGEGDVFILSNGAISIGTNGYLGLINNLTNGSIIMTNDGSILVGDQYPSSSSSAFFRPSLPAELTIPPTESSSITIDQGSLISMTGEVELNSASITVGHNVSGLPNVAALKNNVYLLGDNISVAGYLYTPNASVDIQATNNVTLEPDAFIIGFGAFAPPPSSTPNNTNTLPSSIQVTTGSNIGIEGSVTINGDNSVVTSGSVNDIVVRGYTGEPRIFSTYGYISLSANNITIGTIAGLITNFAPVTLKANNSLTMSGAIMAPSAVLQGAFIYVDGSPVVDDTTVTDGNGLYGTMTDIVTAPPLYTAPPTLGHISGPGILSAAVPTVQHDISNFEHKEAQISAEYKANGSIQLHVNKKLSVQGYVINPQTITITPAAANTAPPSSGVRLEMANGTDYNIAVTVTNDIGGVDHGLINATSWGIEKAIIIQQSYDNKGVFYTLNTAEGIINNVVVHGDTFTIQPSGLFFTYNDNTYFFSGGQTISLTPILPETSETNGVIYQDKAGNEAHLSTNGQISVNYAPKIGSGQVVTPSDRVKNRIERRNSAMTASVHTLTNDFTNGGTVVVSTPFALANGDIVAPQTITIAPATQSTNVALPSGETLVELNSGATLTFNGKAKNYGTTPPVIAQFKGHVVTPSELETAAQDSGVSKYVSYLNIANPDGAMGVTLKNGDHVMLNWGVTITPLTSKNLPTSGVVYESVSGQDYQLQAPVFNSNFSEQIMPTSLTLVTPQTISADLAPYAGKSKSFTTDISATAFNAEGDYNGFDYNNVTVTVSVPSISTSNNLDYTTKTGQQDTIGIALTGPSTGTEISTAGYTLSYDEFYDTARERASADMFMYLLGESRAPTIDARQAANQTTFENWQKTEAKGYLDKAYAITLPTLSAAAVSNIHNLLLYGGSPDTTLDFTFDGAQDTVSNINITPMDSNASPNQGVIVYLPNGQVDTIIGTVTVGGMRLAGSGQNLNNMVHASVENAEQKSLSTFATKNVDAGGMTTLTPSSNSKVEELSNALEHGTITGKNFELNKVSVPEPAPETGETEPVDMWELSPTATNPGGEGQKLVQQEFKELQGPIEDLPTENTLPLGMDPSGPSADEGDIFDIPPDYDAPAVPDQAPEARHAELVEGDGYIPNFAPLQPLEDYDGYLIPADFAGPTVPPLYEVNSDGYLVECTDESKTSLPQFIFDPSYGVDQFNVGLERDPALNGHYTPAEYIDEIPKEAAMDEGDDLVSNYVRNNIFTWNDEVKKNIIDGSLELGDRQEMLLSVLNYELSSHNINTPGFTGWHHGDYADKYGTDMPVYYLNGMPQPSGYAPDALPDAELVEDDASSSEDDASSSEDDASSSEDDASSSEDDASSSEDDRSSSEDDSSSSDEWTEGHTNSVFSSSMSSEDLSAEAEMNEDTVQETEWANPEDQDFTAPEDGFMTDGNLGGSDGMAAVTEEDQGVNPNQAAGASTDSEAINEDVTAEALEPFTNNDGYKDDDLAAMDSALEDIGKLFIL